MCNIVNHNLVFYPNGDVSLCCLASEVVGNINNQTWEEIWNGEKAREHRRNVAQGIPDGCKHCARYLHRESTEEPVTEEGGKITHLDFRFDNVCNCKCLMCSEGASSRFGKRIVVSEEGYQEIEKMLEANKETIRRVHLAGGEPLISPKILKILTKIVDLGIAGNVVLSYNTNASILSPEHEQLWYKFQEVLLDVSVDGIGRINELQRVGSKWNDVVVALSHYKFLRDNPEFKVKIVRIHPAVTKVTLPFLYELDSYMDEFGIEVAWGNVVDSPKNMSPFSLPATQLTNLIRTNLKWAKTEDFKIFMQNLLNSVTNV